MISELLEHLTAPAPAPALAHRLVQEKIGRNTVLHSAWESYPFG